VCCSQALMTAPQLSFKDIHHINQRHPFLFGDSEVQNAARTQIDCGNGFDASCRVEKPSSSTHPNLHVLVFVYASLYHLPSLAGRPSLIPPVRIPPIYAYKHASVRSYV